MYHVFTRVSVATIKQHDHKQLGGEKALFFFHFHIQSITWGSWGRNQSKDYEDCCLSTCSSWLSWSAFLQSPLQSAQKRNWDRELGPPTSNIQREITLQTYLQANLEEAFSLLGFLLSNNSWLYQANLKVANTRQEHPVKPEGRDLNISTHRILTPDYRHSETSCHHAFPHHDWLQTLKPWTFLCLSCLSDILFQ